MASLWGFDNIKSHYISIVWGKEAQMFLMQVARNF